MFLLEYERSEKNKAEIDSKAKIVTEELSDSNKAYDNTKLEYERLEKNKQF